MKHLKCVLQMALAALVGLLISSCATTTPDPAPWPADAETLRKSPPSVCSPVVAKQRVSKGFKYGCFCGKDHPKIEPTNQRRIEDMTHAERTSLVREYLSMAPIDDLDAACQHHDICWVRHGRPTTSCNDEFSAL